MAKIKHNKIKNIGVLFELLTRQITSDTLNSSEKSPAISIIKEYFEKMGQAAKISYDTIVPNTDIAVAGDIPEKPSW